MPRLKIAPDVAALVSLANGTDMGRDADKQLRALLAVARAVDRWRNRVATQEEVEGAMERASLRLERISKGAKKSLMNYRTGTAARKRRPKK